MSEKMNNQMNEEVMAATVKKDKVKTVVSVMCTWLLALFLVFVSLIDMMDWNIFYPNRVQIEATVVENVSNWHYRKYGKSGREYDVYVSYEYNGTQYKHVLIRDDVKRSKPLEEGSKITIEVSPLLPRKTLSKPSIKPFMRLPLAFACFVMGIVIIVAVKCKRRK